MGAACQVCNQCDESFEYCFGGFQPEPFQNNKIKLAHLNKYDQFYRIVCDPFPDIEINDFNSDMIQLRKQIDKESEMSTSTDQRRSSAKYSDTMDLVPYVKFIEFFKERPQWRHSMSDVDSCFMRLLQIDDLFYKKQIITPGNEQLRNSEINHTPIKSSAYTYKKSDISPGDRSIFGVNSQSDSPFNNLDFDRDKSEIRQLGKDGKELIIQISIDTFALTMFAILFCRGTVRQKSLTFFDAIKGPQGSQSNSDTISWKSTRMHKAFRYFVYFSEIFPKKYQTEFINSLFSNIDSNGRRNSIRNSNKLSNRKNRNHFYEEQMLSQEKKTPQEKLKSSSKFSEQKKSNQIVKEGEINSGTADNTAFFWSEEYLILAEQYFDSTFNQIYEEHFIDKIMTDNESFVTRTDFIQTISADVEEQGIKAGWIFKTQELRSIFQANLNIDEIRKEL